MERSLRVLVAEDQVEGTEGLSDMLRGIGHTVVATASSEAELMELVGVVGVELVVVDTDILGHSGDDSWCSALRDLMHRYLVALVCVSSKLSEGWVQEATEAGVMGCLAKPVLPERLSVMVEVAMAHYEQLRHLYEEVGDLREALETRKVLERAKGILMERLEVTEEEAYNRLQRASRNGNRKLADLARAVVENPTLLT